MPEINTSKRTRNRTSQNTGLGMITSWKQAVIREMLKDQELCKLLKYDRSDALDMPDLTEDEREDLRNTHIFDFRLLVDPVQDKKSIISISIQNFTEFEAWRRFSHKYLMGLIQFHSVCDRSIVRLNDGTNRADHIAERLDIIFNGFSGIGMGTLEIQSHLELLEHNGRFVGYSTGYRIIDMK